MKLKKGDTVKVLSGKDRGVEGEVMRAIPQKNMVIVDGVNVARKSQRAVRATMQAGIIDKDMPVPASKVALLCPSCKRPTRIGYRFDGANKVRICRKCGGDV
ncbi:MAG: 50S ribosomal protein L24 [Actinobacteria bacterium]|nr:50S ribosomal protein L24 [Actinomycetota bacterium]